jgi:acyl-CoA synthetase (AMP-forming)/AMP-acid ligase II
MVRAPHDDSEEQLMENTIYEILEAGNPAAPALLAPGRIAMDYAGLKNQVDSTVAALNSRGIGRGDRVAIVLANGPEMASAFLSVAAGATAAPLNPAYKEEEFDFYLSDLKAKALIVKQGDDSPAISVAKRLGVSVIEVAWDEADPAGTFTLLGDIGGKPTRAGAADANDFAMVLHTSGTTSRPKIVPLSQANVAASARHICESLVLTPEDRCFNIMPLFHIHGLIAAVLSSIGAGASIFCCPGFNALSAFRWMEEAMPTWVTAVPTMHQAILGRAPNNKAIIEKLKLRFLRSSSAAMPPVVMGQLEETFGVPVIEAYGMTEAAHQMASNPLPPKSRKAGSVGLAAGPEISIMDEAGTLLPSGSKGEIVIRGPNVFTSYENNPKATEEAFTNGWFRTGDQGVMDAGGYVALTGRLKEIINRGGEKVSPREVDDILMEHPAVDQVVTFAMPHAKLGEDVAAAVVLKDGAEADIASIRDFAAKRLAAFKVPGKIVFLEEIPKGATGKLQRVGLAEKLGLV